MGLDKPIKGSERLRTGEYGNISQVKRGGKSALKQNIPAYTKVWKIERHDRELPTVLGASVISNKESLWEEAHKKLILFIY